MSKSRSRAGKVKSRASSTRTRRASARSESVSDELVAELSESDDDEDVEPISSEPLRRSSRVQAHVMVKSEELDVDLVFPFRF